MSLAATAVFVAALAVAMAWPGPANVALVARVLARGRRDALGFAAGLVLGDVLWFAAAVFGLATLAAAAHELMVALKYLGALYLTYLALRLMTAPVAGDAEPRGARRWGALLGGVGLALANPKTMMFYLALLPSLIDLGAVGPARFLALTAMLVLLYALVLGAYILGAARARRMLASAAARRAINRGSGAVLLGTAAYVAARS